MKTVVTILCLTAAIVAAVFLFRGFSAPAGESATPLSATSAIPNPAAHSESVSEGSGSAAPASTPVSKPSFWRHPPPTGDFDPMLVMAVGDFSDEEIARYNDLHILPFNKAVGQECQELPDPNFIDRDYTSCKTIREFPEHPYVDLETQALLELAVHDEVAALMLGRRVVEEEERLSWYLRATALSGKSGPLMALAGNRYNSVHELKTVDGKFQAVAQPASVAVRIALDIVAKKMGDPRANPKRWRQVLRDLPVENPEGYLARANDLAKEFLVTMAHTQREITGSVQMQEIINNA